MVSGRRFSCAVDSQQVVVVQWEIYLYCRIPMDIFTYVHMRVCTALLLLPCWSTSNSICLSVFNYMPSVCVWVCGFREFSKLVQIAHTCMGIHIHNFINVYIYICIFVVVYTVTCCSPTVPASTSRKYLKKRDIFHPI